MFPYKNTSFLNITKPKYQSVVDDDIIYDARNKYEKLNIDVADSTLNIDFYNTVEDIFAENNIELEFLNPNKPNFIGKVLEDNNMDIQSARGMLNTLLDQRKKKEANKMFAQISRLKETNTNEDIQKLPTNEQELQQYKSEIIYANALEVYNYNQRPEAEGFLSQALPVLGARLTSPTELASIAVPVGGAYKLGATVLSRIAKATIGVTGVISLGETLQNKAAQDMIEQYNLRSNNEALRDEIMQKTGINLNDIVASEETLNKRVFYAFLAGLIGTPTLGLGAVGVSKLGKILKGDTDTLIKLGDDVEDGQHTVTSQKYNDKFESKPIDVSGADINNPSKYLLSDDFSYNNYLKMLEAETKIMQEPGFFAREIVQKPTIDNIDEATDLILKLPETPLNKKQQSILKDLVYQENKLNEMHNAASANKTVQYNTTKDTYEFIDNFKIDQTVDDLSVVTKENNEKLMTIIDEVGVDKNFVIRTFKNSGIEIDDIDGFITKTKELDEVDAKNQLLQASVMERLVFDLLNQKKLNPNLTFEKNLMALAEGGYKEKGVVVHNLTSLMDGLRDDVFGMLDSKALYNIPHHKFKNLDMQDVVKYVVDDIVPTNPATKIFAENVKKVFDMVIQLENKFGGRTKYFKGFFPVKYTPDKVAAVSEKKFLNDIIDGIGTNLRLVAKNYNIEGIDQLADETVEQLLRDRLKNTYTRIQTGDTERTFGATTEKLLDLQGQHTKRIVYQDSEKLLKILSDYGEIPFDGMFHYLRHMQTNISLLRMFGPNHKIGAESIAKFANALDRKTDFEKTTPSKAFENVLDVITGKSNVPQTNRSLGGIKFAQTGNFIRSAQTASQMGSAAVLVPADVVYGTLTKTLNGMPVSKTIDTYLKLIYKDKNLARDMGVGLEDLLDDMFEISRITGETYQKTLSSRLAQGVIKYSGLTYLTKLGQKSFAIEFQRLIGKESRTPWKNLNLKTKYMAERYNITEQDWSALSKIKLTNSKYDSQSKFMKLIDIKDEQLRLKMQNWSSTEGRAATPTAANRVRAAQFGGTQQGEGMGELRRFFFQYKNFPMTVMWTHLNRAFGGLSDHPSAYMKYTYPVKLISYTTMMGAALYNLRMVLQGKDPEPWNEKTLAKGMMYGGGLGIFGDILLYDGTSYGSSPLVSFMGPFAGTVQDLHRLTLGKLSTSIYKNNDWQKTYPVSVVNFLNRYTPGTNLWYLRLAKERLLVDNIRQTLDPQYRSKVRREQKQLREKGSDFWWRRGESTPYKHPKFSNYKTWKPTLD